MSGVARPRQRGGIAWRALHVLFGAVFVACGLVAALGLFLAWRLAQGPVDVTPLVRTAERLRADLVGPRVSVSRATVAWNGFGAGPGSALVIRLHDLGATTASGAAAASAAEADITLAALPLLEGRVVPRRVVLDRVTLRATRAPDGTISLDIAEPDPAAAGDGLGDILAELRRPPSADAQPTLAALEQVTVHRAHIEIADAQTRLTLAGTVENLDLRRQPGGGITGAAEASLNLGPTTLGVHVAAELRAAGGTHVEANLRPLATGAIGPADWAQLDPALAGLGVLDTMLDAHGTLDLSPALRPLAASFQLAASSGSLAVPHSAPVAFDGASVTASAAWEGKGWRPASIAVSPAELVAVSPGGHRTHARLTADASAAAPGRWTVRTALAIDHADFADLAALWPAAWGGHVRPWLTENVTDGTAHDAALTATIDLPLADPARAVVTEAGGTLAADGVVVHWLRPVPPIEGSDVVLTVAGPDTLVITVPRAQQGALAMTDGMLRFTGMAHKDQYLALTAAVSGPVSDVIHLLREKRLQILDAHPLPITGSAGKAAGRLTVNVPMFDHLTFDQVSIASEGRLTGLRLNGLVAGRDVSDADIAYRVSQNGLDATGPATLAGIPGQVDIAMDFKPGAPTATTERAHFAGRVDPPALATLGLDPSAVFTGGTALLDATYTERRTGPADLALSADLSDATLAALGWRKPRGPAARATAALAVGHGGVLDMPAFSATGPGLDIAGRADFADGALRTLRVPSATIGQTRGSGDLAVPPDRAAPLRLRATLSTLDAADAFRRLSDPGSGSADGRDWTADLRADRVLLPGGTLTDVAAHAERRANRLRALTLTSGGAEALHVTLAPAPPGRHLLASAGDTGALLRTLDWTSSVSGGRLAVDATFDDRTADSPLQGRIDLSQFNVHDAVVLGKLLQAVTIYGLVDALRGNGVFFADAQVPFCWCGNQTVQLGPAHATSNSLGLTASGTWDLAHKTIALTGSVVPAYVVNAALGRLPLIGRLFSSERNGGLIAANFRIAGPVGSPDVRVNPLSLLTPGILRHFFDVFR